MAKTKYRVVRPHDGDRWYAEGDIRLAEANDVKHLVPHVLEPVMPAGGKSPGAKADRPLKNKAETITANKAGK